MDSQPWRLPVAVMAVLSLAAFSALSAAPQPHPPDSNENAALAKARQTADFLTEKLKALLSSELASGGFAGAVDACSRSAQQTTKELATAQGVSLRRVSTRYRNSADIPDDWEQAKLQQFTAARASGSMPNELYETVRHNGKQQLRYARPILLQPMCVSCHGEPGKIPADVRQALSRHYPQDLATGFQPGELRGIISVTVPLP